MYKRICLPLTLFLGLAGCTDDDEPTGTFTGTLAQSAPETIANAAPCDAVTPCPDDQECVLLDAEGVDGPICIAAGTACSLLECGPGACIALESYPPMITCADDDGVCLLEGSDCDTPDDSDDGVCSSDGTCTEPPGDDDVCNDEEGCTEPPGGGNDEECNDGEECSVPGSPGGTEPCPAGGCSQPGDE